MKFHQKTPAIPHISPKIFRKFHLPCSTCAARVFETLRGPTPFLFTDITPVDLISPMKTFEGYRLIKPDDLSWRLSNLMNIPNADYLERTGSENLAARLWRMPPKSANTLHKHIRQEEFYFVLEGTGRMRIGDETLTIPRYGAVLVGPDQLRQVFNDTESEVLWLIVGAPEELEFLKGSKSNMDLSLIYPTDPKQLPKELEGAEWPPKT